jgi:hypothetical protein
MPATSQAALRRKLAGIEPKKDETKAQNGRKGAQKRHQLSEQQIKNRENGKKAAGVARGGKLATVSQQSAFLAKLQDEKELTRIRVGAIAARNAERAVHVLVELMNNSSGDVPAAVRRLAALDLIQIAGAGADAQKAAEKELTEMTAAELMEFIQRGQKQLEQMQNEPIEADFVEIPLNGQPETAFQQAQPAD